MADGNVYDKTKPFGNLGTKYEYCVMFSLLDPPHRGPMSKNDAELWVAEWIADGGREDAFFVARREVVSWQKM